MYFVHPVVLGRSSYWRQCFDLHQHQPLLDWVGESIGQGAQRVSHRHQNFIVAIPQASSPHNKSSFRAVKCNVQQCVTDIRYPDLCLRASSLMPVVIKMYMYFTSSFSIVGKKRRLRNPVTRAGLGRQPSKRLPLNLVLGNVLGLWTWFSKWCVYKTVMNLMICFMYCLCSIEHWFHLSFCWHENVL